MKTLADRRTAALLSALLAGLAGLFPAPPASAAETTAAAPAWRAVHEGIAVEVTLEPLGAKPGAALQEGDSARVHLRFTDSHGGTPLTGLSPGAWLDRLARGEDLAATCKPKIESFLSGSFLSRPAVDLNSYYALTLNEDASIAVVDPLFGFGNSQLLAMVFLQSPGEDWVLAKDGERLFVSLPDSGAVAAVDTATWKVLANVPTGPRPRRLGLPPTGRYLFVAHDGAGPGVTVIDAQSLAVVTEIATGAGPHDLAWSDDGRFVFVANQGAGTVSVLDSARLAKTGDVQLGKTGGPRAEPASIAWSSQAHMAYAVDRAGGTVSAMTPDATVVARIVVAPGLGPLRFAPSGRLGFLLHPSKNQVLLLDTATNRIVQTADVLAQPDQVTFSENLAYVRHQGSDTVLMIPLSQVGQEGRPVPLVDFPGGQHPPGQTPRPTPADGIVRAPGDPAVLVANPLDKAIYYYKEGMAAPMGHFQSYGHNPRAVLVLDRSLRPVAPGTYETTAKLGEPGHYELALYLDNPRLLHCFPVEVAVDPIRAAERQPLHPLNIALLSSQEGLPDRDTAVRFRLTDPMSGKPRTGLQDVRVLTFLSPGVWQQRQWASEVGDGGYEIHFRPPEAGLYFVFIEVGSAGMPVERSRALTLNIRLPEARKEGGRP